MAATGARAGIVCIAGTGSLAWGCTMAGHTARAGGWGATWGDEGSGFMIGQQALRLLTRMADGRRAKTTLWDALLKELDLQHPSDLTAWARERNPSQLKHDIAELAPAVLRMADMGELAARGIRAQALAHLTLMIQSVERQLEQYESFIPQSASATKGPKTAGPPPRPVVCVGGLWQHSGLIESLRQSLKKMGLDHLRPTRLDGSAAGGALRLAQQAKPL